MSPKINRVSVSAIVGERAAGSRCRRKNRSVSRFSLSPLRWQCLLFVFYELIWDTLFFFLNRIINGRPRETTFLAKKRAAILWIWKRACNAAKRVRFFVRLMRGTPCKGQLTLASLKSRRVRTNHKFYDEIIKLERINSHLNVQLFCC